MPYRDLVPDADGMVEIEVLGNPIPRHISVVKWGANNAPIVMGTYQSVDPVLALHKLRQPPSVQVMDVAQLDLNRLTSFVLETLDIWGSVMQDLLNQPLGAAQRGAMARGLTVQAGARIAAFITCLPPGKAQQVAASYQSQQQVLPAQPATFDTELFRRAALVGIQQAGLALLDQVLTSCTKPPALKLLTEQVLTSFSSAADLFDAWFSSIQDGPVGVAQRAAPPVTSEDRTVLTQIMNLAQQALGPVEGARTMDPKILQEALSNPAALKAALKDAPPEVQTTFKDVWGDTGHMQEEVPTAEKLFGGKLGGVLGLISTAVSGLDLVNAGTGGDSANNKVVSSLKAASPVNADLGQRSASAFGVLVAHELKAHPTGILACTLKEFLAPSIAASLKAGFEAVYKGGSPAGGEQNIRSLSDLKPELPGQK